MKSILIDCRHVGHEFKRARKSANIKLNDAAKMLGTDRRHLRRYECGKEPWPDNMIHRLTHYGYTMLRAKHLTDTSKRK